MYFHNTISSITFIMQSLKQCFEVKHRKKKGGRRFIYFQIVENHMYVFIYILQSHGQRFRLYWDFQLLSMTLFLFHFVPSCILCSHIFYLPSIRKRMYIHKFLKNPNNKKNYVYDVKYITTYTTYYTTRSQMVGIAFWKVLIPLGSPKRDKKNRR